MGEALTEYAGLISSCPMNTAPLAEREALAGLVERVTFHNAGQRLLRAAGEGARPARPGHRGRCTPPPISAGEFVQASGSWVNDRTHGPQFKAAFLKAAPPTTLEGIEHYLGSGMIKGIGPVYAGKLVAAFGEAVFDVIEQAPERLQEIAGIGPKRARADRRGWADQKVIREIMLFLHSHGVGTSRAVRIFKTYGADAVQVITENPYRLARDIRGIGFKSADQIAMRLGIEKTAMIRARAGISYALAEAMDEGHCGLPLDELRELAAELLEIAAEMVDAALELELRRRCGGRRHGRGAALPVPGRALPRRAGHRRAAARGCAGAARPGPRSTRTRPYPGSSRRPASAWPRASGRRCGWRCAPSCW